MTVDTTISLYELGKYKYFPSLPNHAEKEFVNKANKLSAGIYGIPTITIKVVAGVLAVLCEVIGALFQLGWLALLGGGGLPVAISISAIGFAIMILGPIVLIATTYITLKILREILRARIHKLIQQYQETLFTPNAMIVSFGYKLRVVGVDTSGSGNNGGAALLVLIIFAGFQHQAYFTVSKVNK